MDGGPVALDANDYRRAMSINTNAPVEGRFQTPIKALWP
jgi:hypothetical protein